MQVNLTNKKKINVFQVLLNLLKPLFLLLIIFIFNFFRKKVISKKKSPIKLS